MALDPQSIKSNINIILDCQYKTEIKINTNRQFKKQTKIVFTTYLESYLKILTIKKTIN